MNSTLSESKACRKNECYECGAKNDEQKESPLTFQEAYNT